MTPKPAVRQTVLTVALRLARDAWAGLRSSSPDGLPILGATSVLGYHIATGHYRDGILLAPITAQVVAQLITGQTTSFDLAPFSPLGFNS